MSFPKTAWVLIYKHTLDFKTFINLTLVNKTSQNVSNTDINTRERLDEYKILFRQIEKNPFSLRKISIDKHFDELYLKAVKQNGNALKYVPEKK